MRLLWLGRAFLLLVTSLGGLWAEENPTVEPLVDPMLWSPPQKRPALRSYIPDDVYRNRAAEALLKAKAYRDRLAQLPEFGLKIESVAPDTQADKAGLRPGWIMLKLDGEPLHPTGNFNDKRTNRPQELTVQDTDGGLHKYTIQPGLIGLRYYPWHRPEPCLPESVSENAKWWRDLMVAAFVSYQDPPLAGTALARAVEAGLPETAAMDEQVALLLLRSFDYAAAMDYAWFALQADPKLGGAAQTYFSAAMASYRYRAALEALNKYPQLDASPTKTIARLIREHEALPQSERIRPLPSVEATTLFMDDILLRPVIVGNMPAGLKECVFQGALDLRVANGPVVFALGIQPEVQDVTVECQFTVCETDPHNDSSPKHFTIGVVDMANAPQNARNERVDGMLSLTVSNHGIFLNHPRSDLSTRIAYNVDLKAPFDSATRFRDFKLAVFRGRAEMYLDNRRIYYGPLDLPAPRLAVCLKSSGMSFQVRHWSAYEILDEKARKVKVDPEINKTYFNQQTRLHRAAGRQTLDGVKKLLALGADLNARGERGETPIQLAARVLRKDVIDYLLQQGAPCDPLVAAAIGDPKRLTASLAQHPDWACPGPFTPLHVAAKGGYAECVRLLLDAGADPNARTRDPFGERTPLMLAASEGHLEIVKLLVDRGAKVNLGGKEYAWRALQTDPRLPRRTALAFAIEAGKLEVVGFLKAHNALEREPKKDPAERKGVKPPVLPPDEF